MFKTCSVNSDVKEAREDVKDMEGTWELLPKVRFLDAMTCFCQAVLNRLITVLVFTINPAFD